MGHRNGWWLAVLGIAAAAGCAPAGGRPAEVRTALEGIQEADLKEHVRVLSEDQMEGRGPGSPGEEVATAYIAGRFEAAGLRPAGENGTWFQAVPLVGITADSAMDLTLRGAKETRTLRYRDEFTAGTRRVEPEVRAEGDLVFVGYGTQAPEYQWDDYKGLDVTGKILVMLVNDPPMPDETLFRGKAMTYYGRWTYKYDKAREMGAAGAILVHETKAAGYPWETVKNSWSGEQFHLRAPDGGADELRLESWVTHAVAEDLFRMAGLDLAEQERAAVSRDFRPVPLGIRAEVTLRNTLRSVDSKNVLAMLEGSDPALKDQYVIYMAHWDHLGMNPETEGDDKIFNGAYDNATGTSALFELAEAYAALPSPPRRSILFLAVTAEEQGLLGSEYYAEYPLYPLAQTAAAINMDGMNIWGRTRDMVVVGMGNSTLDDGLQAVASEQGRVIVPDAEPEKGFYYRSDQFSFAKKGVPSIYTDPGVDFPGRPEGWGLEQREKYTAEDYHKPSDEFDPAWDLSGAREDVQALFLLGLDVAQADGIPEWREGNEFRKIREDSLRATAASR